MPLDKLKHPKHFPNDFFRAIAIPDLKRERIICISPEKKVCKREARRFRCFLKSLAQYPLHPAQQEIADYEVSTRIKPISDFSFAVYVNVKQKIDVDKILWQNNF